MASSQEPVQSPGEKIPFGDWRTLRALAQEHAADQDVDELLADALMAPPRGRRGALEALQAALHRSLGVVGSSGLADGPAGGAC